METIKVKKDGLYHAVTACNTSGKYWLTKDGDFIWQQNGGFPLPDNALCPVPVANSDGSGELYDDCWEVLKEKFNGQWYESDYDGSLKNYIEDVILSGDSPIDFIKSSYPDEFEQIINYERDQAIEELIQSLEAVEVWVDEFTQETRSYTLEII